jgi:predicted Zn-dependent protease
MQGLKWEFSVINSPEVNAFVVPGGKVVVYTGLLQLLKTEDELAAVIAHEAGHVVARHVAERLTQGSVVELLRQIAYFAFSIPIPAGALTAVFFLPNSRKAETEADVIGLQLAARACYDPAAAAVVFKKLGEEEAKHGEAAIPKMLRTHPVTSDRIKKITEMLPRAELLREAAGCNVGVLDAFERQFIGAATAGGS